MSTNWPILFLVSLTLLVTGWFADHLNNQRFEQGQKQAVFSQANLLRTRLESNIQYNVASVQGMVGLIASEPDLDQPRFAKFAAAFIENRTQLRNLSAAPDLVIRLIYPIAGNEGAIGFDLKNDSRQGNDALKSRDTGRIVMSGPVNLVQGGQGFIARLPIFITGENQKKHFWGTLSAVIDVDRFLAASGMKDPDLPIKIALVKKNVSAANDSLIYGDNTIFIQKPEIFDLSIPGADWQLLAIPKNGWAPHADNVIQVRLLIGIVFLSILGPLLLLVRSQQKRNLQEHRLRALFEMSPVGIALNDFSNGKFVEWNDALVASTGYSHEEFLRLNYWDLTPKEYADQETLQLESLKNTGRYGPYEKEYIRKDGSRYPVLLNGVLIKDDSGSSYIWSIVEDISAQKDAERILIEARESAIAAKNVAEAATLAKSEFLATMSHEIRTPLNGVLGMLDLLARGTLSNEQQRRVDVARSSAKFLLAIINDILDFSKIDAEKLELETIDFDLAKLLSDFVSVIELETRTKNLALNVQLNPAGPMWVNGDPGRIRQIMYNLVSNAIKFTDKGAIEISAELFAQNDNWQFKCSVRDSGIGIAVDHLPKLFEVFSQVDATTTRKYGGSGLGLAICDRLCRIMGGNIKVESREGEGSCFTFCISLNAAKAPSPDIENQMNQSTPTNLPANCRILLVEDNHFNQEVAKMLLEELGADAEIAENGKQAITWLQDTSNQSIDLILMDCQMPEMDGYEASQRIRQGEAGERFLSIPIIALTANALPGDMEKCLQSGMNDYLSKPIDADALLEKLNYWLEEHP